ncbi:signal peptidase I [Nocardioides sambongensis]|uniref:signal peptidase I n=1 Tax=Nocardioides sambongensis TaxID=2589074 RepID=UPI001E2A12D1|nr:signal peptidase I [Nocardioides sambongensis]
MTSDAHDTPEESTTADEEGTGARPEQAGPDGAVGAGDGTDAEPAGRKRKPLPIWLESVVLLGVALGMAIIIKALFVQAFYIPSESMEPGLVENDRILVQKVSYWFGGTPQRGDVVVFEDPGGWLSPSESEGPTGFANVLSKIGLYPTGGHLVKRVIGTEGDVITCCDKQGRIKVNGVAVDESEYLAEETGSCVAERGQAGVKPCNWSIGPVPEDKLFVMGDNRAHSADSRVHICAPDQDPCTESPWVDTDLVVGKMFALVWPRDRWTWVSRPDAFANVPDDPPATDE